MRNTTQNLDGFTQHYFLKKNSAGFTLIELLVVIAIIGILATLLLVQFGNVRARGRDTQRISHIKNLQTALELYRDSNGDYPDYPANNCGSGYKWTDLETDLSLYLSRLPDDPSDDNAKPLCYIYQKEEDLTTECGSGATNNEYVIIFGTEVTDLSEKIQPHEDENTYCIIVK